jgi:hypothetical protein
MALTMASVRDGLKTRLATITGLRAHDTVPDSLNPPAAIVSLPTAIEYDLAMSRGLDKVTYPITVVVSRASERSGQDKLDAYCNSSGSTSIKTAIEGDKTLGGTASTCRVSEVSRVGELEVGGITYLAAEFLVDVWG